MSDTSGRRTFIGTAGLLLVKPATAFGSQANSAVELGIVGAGGRGNWIGGHFKEHTLCHIAAFADPFADRLETAGKKFGPAVRLYRGIDGYKELLASAVDAVAIESPPYFHPEQVAAAVAAGKHVFIAKPLAVDVPGCRSILESAAKARGKLSILADFQTRARPAFQEAARRVHGGDIGTPAMGHVFYHAGRLTPQGKPGMPPAEMRLRNWVFDKALSGDIIVEQNIHVIDVANWYLKGHPVHAAGAGGRKVRTDTGDCWDHFVVTYEYPNGVKVDFSSNQFIKGFSDLCIRVYGDRGTVDSHYGGYVRITGDVSWNAGDKDDTFTGGAIANAKEFIESIRSSRYLNTVADGVESNLTAILGRMAAYEGRKVTWDEMMRANQKLEANLRL
jgi:predicted dehydrogenase